MVAILCEWISTLLILCYALTLGPDFRKLRIYRPKVKLVGNGGHDHPINPSPRGASTAVATENVAEEARQDLQTDALIMQQA